MVQDIVLVICGLWQLRIRHKIHRHVLYDGSGKASIGMCLMNRVLYRRVGGPWEIPLKA